MKRVYRGFIALVVGGGVLAACGSNGDSDRVSEVATPGNDGVVAVTMRDLRFEPNRIRVAEGQVVTLEFRNEGKVPHEAFIGTDDEQEMHEREMVDSSSTTTSGMDMSTTSEGMHPGSELMIRVDPGKTGSIRYKAPDAEQHLVIGCHEPGHWKAGMLAYLDVE